MKGQTDVSAPFFDLCLFFKKTKAPRNPETQRGARDKRLVGDEDEEIVLFVEAEREIAGEVKLVKVLELNRLFQ